MALRLIAAAMMVPVPRGLVSTRACPAFKPPLLIKLPSLAVPVTLKPASHKEEQMMNPRVPSGFDICERSKRGPILLKGRLFYSRNIEDAGLPVFSPCSSKCPPWLWLSR